MVKKKIRDVIYGFIELDEQEVEIINHPVFQRLRRIKQLSLTDMVYPGANHTRFEHSLGVMQMATEIYDKIVVKDSAKEVFRGLNIENPGQSRFRKILRLAALLHDIGHAPFSHAGEDCMAFLPENHPRYVKDKKNRFEHEDYSIHIIKHVFKDIIENDSVYRIPTGAVTVLLGDEAEKRDVLSLIFKDLISGQIDADRADYLLRDSIHLGVNYGLYDRNRFINSITLALTETDAPAFAIEKGGWHIAESLVIARYQMFSQVYFHKVRRIYDYHVSKATKAILKADKRDYYPIPEEIDEYLKYDDWYMNSMIHSGRAGKHGEIIKNRQHFKLSHESEDPPSEHDEEKFKELIQNCGNAEYYLDDKGTTVWYKLNKDINISDDNRVIYSLSRKSPIVASMRENSRIKRLYIER